MTTKPPPGPGRATLRDVARAAGVDVSTVSRVLRDTKEVNTTEATRERILRAARQLRYRPNRTAQALKTARSNSIGLVVPYLDHPVNHDLIAAVEEILQPLGMTVVIFHVDETHRPAHRLSEWADISRVDGMIIVARLILEGGFGPLDSLGCPFVVVNEAGGAREAVTFDYAEATDLATRHLIDLGHRDILLVPGPLGRHNAEQRRASFARTFQARGLDPARARVLGCDHGFEHAYRVVAEACAAGLPSSAIIAGTTPIAIGAMAALGDSGRGVPADVSVITMHDSALSAMVRPALTTIAFPVRDLAEIAVTSLMDKIVGGPGPGMVRLPPSGLIARQSTGPGPRDHATAE